MAVNFIIIIFLWLSETSEVQGTLTTVQVQTWHTKYSSSTDTVQYKSCEYLQVHWATFSIYFLNLQFLTINSVL